MGGDKRQATVRTQGRIKDCNVGTYRHRRKRRRAVNGIQGLDTANATNGG